MRIVYHLGAHCTDDERLIRCLWKNRETLAVQGIVVPAPTRYRALLRDTAVTLKGRPASRDTQAVVLDPGQGSGLPSRPVALLQT